MLPAGSGVGAPTCTRASITDRIVRVGGFLPQEDATPLYRRRLLGPKAATYNGEEDENKSRTGLKPQPNQGNPTPERGPGAGASTLISKRTDRRGQLAK